MKRNLTLAIDEEVLIRARVAAIRQHQSVTALVRQFLVQLAGGDRQHSGALRRLARLMDRRPLEVGRKRWTRDELHER
ncbi:MAG: hypothetical protein HY814_02280 [Candidatus Riflebacteria bacterium]|nr:hypothetical protein [Candidatus Riflebacteria bacterium]